MLNNFQRWGDRRKQEVQFDSTLAEEKKLEETKKLDDRMGKFADKMGFLQQYKLLPVRRHSAMMSVASS
jgi:hypothetical protein